MTKELQINMSFNLIQQIRLTHALTESDFDISIPDAEKAKFDTLTEKFGVQFLNDSSQCFDITSYLDISRTEPSTAIGGVSRHLIFPHAITSYCRSLWPDKREFRYSFQGLVTNERRPLIEH